jgi:hypothetical protein
MQNLEDLELPAQTFYFLTINPLDDPEVPMLLSGALPMLVTPGAPLTTIERLPRSWLSITMP